MLCCLMHDRMPQAHDLPKGDEQGAVNALPVLIIKKAVMVMEKRKETSGRKLFLLFMKALKS